MKYVFSILLTLTAIFTASAQFDSSPGNSIAIPRTKAPEAPVTPTAPTKSPFSLTPEKEIPLIGTKQRTFSMIEEESKFVNRSSEYAKRTEVRPQGESSEPYKGNMDFGVIKTKSPFVVLNVRDFGAQDGDRIKITQNDRIIISDVMLTNSGQGIMLTLVDGFNDIRVEALNQGTSGPNTAEFILSDDKEKNLAGNEWNLATGFHAKFLVVKE
ncbi:MAG: hypothetical protein EOO45_13420 [Flavobacterium sp.]|nr:MAG: hypothetical protein EOO45_13420 [Flavobacterium sp.]